MTGEVDVDSDSRKNLLEKRSDEMTDKDKTIIGMVFVGSALILAGVFATYGIGATLMTAGIMCLLLTLVLARP